MNQESVTTSMMITEEQKKRSEENRKCALKRLEERMKRNANTNSNAKENLEFKRTENPRLNRIKLRGSPSGLVCRGNCQLISPERFAVDVKFHKQAIEMFKTVPGVKYDALNKSWDFPIEQHGKLMSLLENLSSEVRIEKLPNYVLRTITKDWGVNTNSDDLSIIESALTEALFPFQKTGLCFGISRNGRVLIADDMGLGKTIEAIGIAAYYRGEWPILVVCPSTMRYKWKEAFQTFLPSLKDRMVRVLDSSKDEVGRIPVLIVSYDLAIKQQRQLWARKFQVVIADESHMLKNYKAARTMAVAPLLKQAKRAILLSGTPALSRPIELFSQIQIVNSSLFPSVHDFALRYCSAKKNAFGWDYSGASNMKELQILLEHSIMIRRIKSDVMDHLPPKRREMIVLNGSEIKCESQSMKANAKEMQNQKLQAMEKRGVLLKYFSETGSVKLKAVCDYILDQLDGGKKMLCFAHHHSVLNGICDVVAQKKYEYVRIDGSTSAEDRKLACDVFQTRDACRVAVLSITAANMGITLTEAQLVIFAELFWNPGILTQAEDRAHRIGQRDSVVVQYLVAKGTADDYLWPLVQEKLNILNKIGLSKDNFYDADTRIMTNQCQQLSVDILFDTEDDSIFADIDLCVNAPDNGRQHVSKRQKQSL